MNTPSHNSRASRRNRRRGIALIFVLGCLAMIVIAAISFASFMKVERLVAAQSLELSRARQAALAGLERAIDRMNRGAGSADFVYDAPGGATNYWPRTAVFMRTPGDARFAGFPSGSMGRDGSMTFLAMDQTAGLPTTLAPDFFTSSVLETPTSTAGPTASNSGAAISIIANASGKIDLGVLNTVNVATGYSRSRIGNIDVSSITTSPNQAALVAMRANALDYYSLPEIRYFPSGSTDLNATSEPNFTFFEQACQQYLSPVSNKFANAVYIGSDLPSAMVKNAAYQANVMEAFFAAGVPPGAIVVPMSKSPILYNFVDYLDDDFLPEHGDTKKFCGEPVPCITEVGLEVIDQIITATNITTKFAVSVELFYPFVGAENTRGYVLRLANVSVPGGTFVGTYVDAEKAVDARWDYDKTGPAINVAKYDFTTAYEFTSPPGAVDAVFGVRLRDGSTMVDAVGEGTNPTTEDPIVFKNLTKDYKKTMQLRYESDPRFNHSPRNSWVEKADWTDLGKFDEFLAYMSVPAGAIAKSEFPFFVKNGLIQSAAELGYIALGDRHWQSIALVTDSSLAEAQKVHRVLDTFTVHLGSEFDGRPVTAGQLQARGGRAGPLVRGLVGLNTDKAPVLQALLLNGDVADRYPGDPGSAATISVLEALTLANNIIACRRAHNNSFMAKSRLGEALNRGAAPSWSAAVNLTWDVPSWTENQYESLLRQFMDLGDVRGNTFVVLVRGYGVINKVMGDQLTSSVELVAHVWRDPQTRRTQIRSIKWVDRDDDSITNL